MLCLYTTPLLLKQRLHSLHHFRCWHPSWFTAEAPLCSSRKPVSGLADEVHLTSQHPYGVGWSRSLRSPWQMQLLQRREVVTSTSSWSSSLTRHKTLSLSRSFSSSATLQGQDHLDRTWWCPFAQTVPLIHPCLTSSLPHLPGICCCSRSSFLVSSLLLVWLLFRMPPLKSSSTSLLCGLPQAVSMRHDARSAATEGAMRVGRGRWQLPWLDAWPRAAPKHIRALASWLQNQLCCF